MDVSRLPPAVFEPVGRPHDLRLFVEKKKLKKGSHESMRTRGAVND